MWWCCWWMDGGIDTCLLRYDDRSGRVSAAKRRARRCRFAAVLRSSRYDGPPFIHTPKKGSFASERDATTSGLLAAALSYRDALGTAALPIPPRRARYRRGIDTMPSSKKQKKAPAPPAAPEPELPPPPPPLRTFVEGARGELADKIIQRPPLGLPACFKCNDRAPDGSLDPLVSKIKTIKVYGAGVASSPEFADAGGYRLCRRAACWKWYDRENKVRRFLSPPPPLSPLPPCCLLSSSRNALLVPPRSSYRRALLTAALALPRGSSYRRALLTAAPLLRALRIATLLLSPRSSYRCALLTACSSYRGTDILCVCVHVLAADYGEGEGVRRHGRHGGRHDHHDSLRPEHRRCAAKSMRYWYRRVIVTAHVCLLPSCTGVFFNPFSLHATCRVKEEGPGEEPYLKKFSFDKEMLADLVSRGALSMSPRSPYRRALHIALPLAFLIPRRCGELLTAALSISRLAGRQHPRRGQDQGQGQDGRRRRAMPAPLELGHRAI